MKENFVQPTTTGMADEAFLSQQDEGSLWDELSNQHSREIHQHRLASSNTNNKWRQNLLSAAAAVSSAASDVASAAAAAASAAAERRRQQQFHRNELRDDRTVGGNVGADAALAEFGLQPSSPEQHQSSYLDSLEEGGGHNHQAAYHKPEGIDSARSGLGDSLLGNETGRNEQTRDNFVFLDRFRLRPRREGWGAVSNLDLFFTSMYNFYYHRGLVPIIGKGLVEITSLFFTLWLSVFLFAYLDWGGLAKCNDEKTCRADFNNYIIEKPFQTFSLWNSLVILYCLLFTCYGVFAVLSFLATLKNAFEAKYIYEEKLGISARKLEGGAVEWDEVVKKMVQLQETGEHRIAIHGQEINALTVAQIIMRKENFMISFMNRQMLDLSLPYPMLRGRQYFSKSLEWSIYFCVLTYMFNHKYKIRPAFFMGSDSLKRRFTLCAIVHAIFMPFLLLFMTLHFSMQHVYDWKASKQYLGPREWSSVALWKFREFNELPHTFERRLGPSYSAAEEYLKLFPKSSIVVSIGRVLVFISGSLGAVLLALAAVNDSILLHVKLGQWNLLWYVGILGVLYSMGKSMLPDVNVHPPYIRNLFAEMDSALAAVASHTHYYPDIWKGRGWDKQTQREFSEMIQYKVKLFVMELVSVMMAPLVLGTALNSCAEELCSFVQKVKIEVPGAGDVCGYSSFDFATFEDENWEGRQIQPSTATSTYETGAINIGSFPKTLQGKLEKSFFSFKAAHPSWKCCSSGQDLVDRLESYQYHQALALAKERNLYVEAAAKQLETLRQLETNSHQNDANAVDESYITQKVRVSEADAGAHSGGTSTKGVHESSIVHIGDGTNAPGLKSSHDNINHRVRFMDGPPSHHSDRDRLAIPSSRRIGTHSNITPHALSASTAHSDFGAKRAPSSATFSAASSVLHYADTALSTELLRVLNRSSLDPNKSGAGSILGATLDQSLPSLSNIDASFGMQSLLEDEDEVLERNAQRQYMWLERYHSHLSSQHQSKGALSGQGGD